MRSLESLKHRNFRLMWTGAILSNTGTWMAAVALSWYVFLLTRSPFWVSFVTFINFVPTVLSPIGGVLTDRFDRKRILVLAQVFMMVNAAALALLAWLDQASLFAVMALTFGQGLGFAINAPAWMAFVPSLVPPESMVNAIALNSAQFSLARVIGPAVAGALIAASSRGVPLIFAINAVSFVTVLIALALVRSWPTPPRQRRTVRDLLMGGLSYTWGHRPIRAMIGAIAVMSLFGAPVTALLPVFAAEVFGRGAEEFGVLAAALGVGSFLGALLLARVGSRVSQASIAATLVCLSATLILFASIGVYAVGVLLMVLYGTAFLFLVAGTNSAIQLQVEEGMRGRVISMWMLAFGAFYPAGSLVAGIAAEAWGAPVTTIAGAAVCAAWGLILLGRSAGPAGRAVLEPGA
ncbi:MAG: MFS transporter [Actinomycetota bacterium]